MLLSVVTGTYNRRESLAQMIASARREIPRGIAYEFVVVDGGSTDGTLEWCKQQPDVYLIQHGALLGAIRAFCDGARTARGEYVLLANDDIEFRPYSIIAAISHLERHAQCGQVAFADNRYSALHGDGTQYRVEGVGATLHDGTEVMVAYGQVSLTRKWLGDRLGWWGAEHPIMGQARTYGGDNFLSAGVWESGYTVDAVPRAEITDRIERDTLRRDNASVGHLDSAAYYRCYPTVHIPAKLADAPASDRLRILHLPIYEQNKPGKYNLEAGLTEALADYGLAIEADVFNEPIDIIELVKVWQPDLMITQIQGPGRFTPYVLASCKNVAPGVVIVNWNGDAHERGLTGADVVEMLKLVDLQTTINAKVLPEYAVLGIRAAYWQIGYKDPVGSLPQVPEYEVLWQGNCYNEKRIALVKMLREVRLENTRRLNVGVYGNCEFADGNTHYDFAAQRALYQKAMMVVGDTYPGTQAFVSNRLFQALAAGAFMLQEHSEGLQDYTGLTPGVHYIEWSDPDDLQAKIREWARPERAEDRRRIAAEGRAFVRENFSFAAQARKLFRDLLPMLEAEHATA